METISFILNSKSATAQKDQTILQAARSAGIEIPALCWREGTEPRTSCFLCAVEVKGRADFVPACAAKVTEGLDVVTHSPEIIATRRMALELLFSDHAGECAAPCEMACFAHIDVPGFIAELARGNSREAVAIIKRTMPFPGVLGYICGAYCEKPCRRAQFEEAISIRLLHRFAAESDFASSAPYLPEKKPATGKRVAIVGAGPAGLSAAWYLLQEGHDCLLLDAREKPGGLLWDIPDSQLDKTVLDREIAVIMKLGARFRGAWRLGESGTLTDLRQQNDAVLLAIGASVNAPSDQRKSDLELLKKQGISITAKGAAADSNSLATNLPGIFAAGEIVTGKSVSLRAIAAGRRASASISQHLTGAPVSGEGKPFFFHRKLTPEEDKALYGAIVKAPRAQPEAGGGLSAAAAHSEALRCLQCGCMKKEDCQLRREGARHGVNPNRFAGERRELSPELSHSAIVYEPGKCILCGLCLKIAEAAGERRGLSFAGRGFPTRVVVPLEGALSEGLEKAARACADACPTAALSIRK
ncbi:MAG: FAD-dependent oxidoreductase [Candidatus Sumerlaeota bacterium]|nr:FAD-dependent oxidoreductase [Candidatus Sumerlaeota bacterium]